MGIISEKLKELGIKLPPAPQPVAAYVPAVQHENLLYISGQLPLENGQVIYTGKVGTAVSIDQAFYAAKLCAVNGLSVIKAHLGDLDRVARIVRVGGFVNSPVGFIDQPKVINGASEFLLEVFGDKGRHARAAVGVNELPLNASVEIEFTVAIKAE